MECHTYARVRRGTRYNSPRLRSPLTSLATRLALAVALVAGLASWAAGQHDLSLYRLASDKYVEAGDIVSVTYVVTNDLGTDVDDIAVEVRIPAGLAYLQHSPGRTFDPVTGVWAVGSLSYRQVQTTITVDFRVVGEGVINLPAEVLTMSTGDVDSAPGNGAITEDDYIGTCFSVPVRAECGQSVRLEAPAGAPGYQWFLDGLPLAGATTQAIDVGESGSYNFELVGAPTTCALGSCCDAVVTFDSISVALSQPTVCTGGFDTVRFDLPEVDDANFDQAYTWSSPDDPGLAFLSCATCPEAEVVVDGAYPGDSLRYALSVVTTDRLSGRVVCSAVATLTLEVLQAPVIQFLTPLYVCAERCTDLEIATDLPTASVAWDGPNLRSPDGYVMEYCPREVADYTAERFVVTAVGLDGCTRVDSVDVVTVPALEVTLPAVADVCQLEAADLLAVLTSSLPPDSVVVAWTEEPGNPSAGANLAVSDALAVTTNPLAPGAYGFRVSVSRVAPDGSLVCAFEGVQDVSVRGDCAQPRLGGYAWRDENGDGLRQDYEPPFAGVTVELHDAAGVPTGATTVTDATGFYEFTELAVGDYRVGFETVAGFAFSPRDVGPDEFLDSDADAAGITAAFATTYDEAVHVVGAGYTPVCNLGIANVVATPSDCGDAVGTISFDVTGAYGPGLTYAWAPDVSTGPSATGLSPGDYEVTVFDPYNACSYTQTLTVPGTRGFTLATSSTPAACPLGSGGSITVAADGGTGPYSVAYAGPRSGVEVAPALPYTVADLLGGDYVVTVTDAGGCSQSDPVIVAENELLIAITVVDFTPAGCGGARDGTFEVVVSGFSAGYDLLVDGLTVVAGATSASTVVTGQAAGPHRIEATDVNGCTQVFDYALPGGEEPIDLATIVVTDVDCHGAATGGIASIAGEAYEVRDSRGQLVGQLPQNALTAGTYTLVNRTGPGCTTTADVAVDQPTPLALDVFVIGEECDALDGSIAASVRGGTAPYTFELDGRLSSDSVFVDLVAGDYALRIIDAADCRLDTFVRVPDLCTPVVCEPFFTADTLVLEEDAPMLAWCMANFEVTPGRTFAVDGRAVEPSPCNRDGLVYFNLANLPGDGETGPYLVEFWAGGDEPLVAHQVADGHGLAEALDSVDAWGRWVFDPEENTVRGGQPDRAYGELEVTDLAGGRTVFLTPRVLANQLSAAVDLAVPGAYDISTIDPLSGCLDRIHVVTRLPDACESAYAPVATTARTPYCDEASTVCIAVPYALLGDGGYALEIDGLAYGGPAEPCAVDERVFYDVRAVDFDGLVHVERWVVDGRVEAVRVSSPEELAARMSVFDGEPWTYDPALGVVRGGDPARDYLDLRLRDAASDVRALSPETVLYDGTLVTLDAGAHAARLVGPTGCAADFSVTLRCSAATPPVVDTVRWTLGVGFTDSICLSTAELPGELARVENLCREASGEYALVDLYGGTCLAGEGVEIGTSEYCLLACDVNDVCDTTIVLIDIVSPEDYVYPEANPDLDSLDMNGVTFVDVLANDELRGTFASLEVVEYPRFGQARILDGEVEYIADPQFCGVDMLVYELCNARGCDTARVDLRIECDELIIYSGFSPNYDDVNETFTVLGIEQFPDNRMRVYNRWGNRVFEAANYDNSWRGTSFDGDDLGEGTYFYVFEDGRGRTYTGYVYIRR